MSRFRSIVRAFCIVGAGSVWAANVAPAAFSQAADGSWHITGPGYESSVNKDGYLTSFKVGEVETLGAPFSYHPQRKLAADHFETAGDTLKVHLRGNKATIDYQFRARTASPLRRRGSGNEYGEFKFYAHRTRCSRHRGAQRQIRPSPAAIRRISSNTAKSAACRHFVPAARRWCASIFTAFRCTLTCKRGARRSITNRPARLRNANGAAT